MIFNNQKLQALNQISYQYLRGIADLSEKMAITAIVITAGCDYYMFADLLYKNESLNYWIDRTNKYFRSKSQTDENDVYLDHINTNQITEKIFAEFIGKVKQSFDEKKFFEALYKKDEFAIAIVDICERVGE